MAESEIAGHFVVRQLSDRAEVHRIPSRYHENTAAGEKTLLGLLRNMDTDRYFVDWDEAK